MELHGIGPPDPFRDAVQPACAAIGENAPWRQPFADGASGPQGPRILAARWRSLQPGNREVSARTPASCHVVGIALRRFEVRFEVDGHMLLDGFALPGLVNVTEPGTVARGRFRGPYDSLHLSVPNELVAECMADRAGHRPCRIPSGVGAVPDPALYKLGIALLSASQLGCGLDELYADSIGLAILARVIAVADGADLSERARTTPLPKWRLKRALDYLEGKLTDRVTLADVAAAVGLSRMHFASQFRAATGQRPHEYLLRRRIERAQELLARSGTPVGEVALEVGFDSQSHFTTVFKRLVGHPPRAWRALYRRAA